MILDAITDRLKETLNLREMEGRRVNVEDSERLLSVAGGLFLAVRGLMNLNRHPLVALQEGLVAGLLLYRGTTGFCPAYAILDKASLPSGGINITETFIVDRPREEVYTFWRRLENMPRFMKHLSSVEELDRKRSQWRANIPGEILKLSWNAEIVNDEPNAFISWKSVEGSMVDNTGSVTFHDEVNGPGTELNVSITYYPPAGSLGMGVGKLLSGVFEDIVRHDVTNFKHYIEGDEYRTYEHKPALWDHVETAVNKLKE